MIKALIAAFVIAATLAVTSAQEPIAIGIVREDGFLMPIALLTDRLFEDPPLPAQTLVNGEPLVAPAPAGPAQPLNDRTWTLLGGRNLKPIEITTLDTAMAWMPYCDERLMWRTTLKGRPVDQGSAPVRKIGIAVSGAGIEFPDDVSHQPDAATRRIARRIVSLFLTKERARLGDQTQDAPIVIKELQQHAVGGSTIYYFEATKARKFIDEGRTYVEPDAGLVTGWIADSEASLKDYEVAYKINDDNSKEGVAATVRGIVRHQGKSLWVLEWHGWEHEYFTVHDWPSGTLRVKANSYDC